MKAGRVRDADEVFDELRARYSQRFPSQRDGRGSRGEPARPLPSPTLALSALIASAEDDTRRRFLEFFAVTIRNPHTRRAYARAAGDFLAWHDRAQHQVPQRYPLPQANAFAMVRRRAAAAGIGTAIGNHSFRATGITTLFEGRRHVGDGRDDGETQLDPHHPALRPQDTMT